jgi:regulator of protease activity HflC (stomatin/prohibitin superfamily)
LWISGRRSPCCAFGRYRGLRGPGLFLIIPIVETLSRYVDQRVRVTSVSAESTLTRDTVPVNVDAIIFWLVWNAEKSILEVEDFKEAITLSSQTALRESIGRHHLAQMITERETMGRELQRILDEKTTSWGITVQSVEIRDVRIPQALENAMSQQAQAERERQARVILGEAEVQVSAQFAEASRVYARQSRRTASARHEHALRSSIDSRICSETSFTRPASETETACWSCRSRQSTSACRSTASPSPTASRPSTTPRPPPSGTARSRPASPSMIALR